MLKSLLNFGKAKSLLVCETDGFLLRGTVLVRSGTELVPVYSAESVQADMADAVADLIKKLKADGWEGGNAVLLSPTVLSTLIELPVSPQKPRPLIQMQELVRWEAEPLLMQHTTQWSVGNLLVGRGYMTEEQAAAVMDLQQGKANPAGGLVLADTFSLRRFGELAEELGYIKRSQLNACLAGQEWLKSDDETIECGWSAQGEVSDVPGTFNWLVTCVNKGLLQRWTHVFQKQGVILQSMYPLAGCSSTLLPAKSDASVVLEAHNGMAFVARLVDDKITSQYLYLNPAKQSLELCLESYHALHASSSDALWLAAQHDDEGLSEELNHALDCELTSLNIAPISDKLSPGMLGAGVHAFGLTGSKRLANARLGGPLPEFWQRVEVRAIALLLALFVVIMTMEASLMIRDNSISKQKAELDAQWNVINSAMRRIKGDIKQVEQRKAELKEQQSNQQREQQRMSFFGKELPERAALVQAILGVLQQSTGEDVVINSIDELGKRVTLMPPPTLNDKKDTRVEVENFNLEAWALSETAAQTFIQDMQQAIEPWNMEVRDSQVIARLGPLNLDGFVVSMRLVKLREADDVNQGSKIQ